jgi:chaperonin GroEL
MSKLIGNAKQFRRAALKALEILSGVVSSTMGPDGASVLIDRGNESPISTKDGVTVSESIDVKDPVVNTLIKAIKEGARRTVEWAGDGTTCTILLTEAFVKESLKFVRADQISAQKLALQLKSIEQLVVDSLDGMKRDVTNEEEILNVALISSNGDREVAEKVVEAVDSAGRDGVISIEESDAPDITITRIEGFKMDSGFGVHGDYSSAFVLDHMKQETLFEKVDVLLYDGNVNDYNELAQGLLALAQTRGKGGALKPTVVVAFDFSGQVRDLVAQNIRKLQLPLMLVKVRIQGTEGSRVQMLDDLGVLLKAKIIRHGDMPTVMNLIGDDLKAYVGTCEKIVQTRSTTTFFGGAGSSEDIKTHTEVIKKQMEEFTSEHDRSLYRARIGRLVSGIVVVRCGGQSELEMRERKDRVEDAINATRAAILEGILPGGGVALLQASEILVEGVENALGIEVFKKALQYPIRQIASNAGESPDVVVSTVLRTSNRCEKLPSGKVISSPNFGFDAAKLEYVNDMYAAGIIDPLRVVKTAFKNALSIAVEILKGGGYSVIVGAQTIKRETWEPDFNMPGENPADFIDED